VAPGTDGRDRWMIVVGNTIMRAWSAPRWLSWRCVSLVTTGARLPTGCTWDTLTMPAAVLRCFCPRTWHRVRPRREAQDVRSADPLPMDPRPASA
jgi:hypothetical protein